MSAPATDCPTPRRFSGFQPTGPMQLGNYLGAIRPMVAGQYDTASVVSVVDLHAMTVDHDPALLPARTLEVATMLLAAGVDPDHTLFFVQSHVPEHSELHYLLECTTGYGEAHRMIQFKEKAGTQEHVRLSLLTYPVLMAADILLYDTSEVPVGDDQSQHVELARDVATRFNSRYGETLVVPDAVNPSFAARVMDLTDPTAKMGKTNFSPAGVLYLLDPPDVVRRKVMRAVTDTGTEVRYDRDAKPGVSNLLEILAACTGSEPATVAEGFDRYGDLKAAVADAVIATLDPVRQQYAELTDDPRRVPEVLHKGAARARDQAVATVARARHAIGLLPAA